MKSLIFGVAIALAILGAGGIMVMKEMTFVNIWLLLSLLFIFGGGIGFLIKDWLARWGWAAGPYWINILIFDILFVCVCGGGILLWNALTVDKDSYEEKEVVVERKIIKTRHKTQTSGRRTYYTGAPYHEYYLEVRYADGRRQEFKPSYKAYKQAAKGDTAFVKVGRGGLFMPVCDPGSFRLKHPVKKKRKWGVGRKDNKTKSRNHSGISKEDREPDC